jgi:hypothetical protein
MRGDYETAPAGKGEWKVQQHGGRRAVKMHARQSDAWKQTKDLARSAGTEALLKNRGGEIRERNSYGNDPCPPKG